MGIEAKDKDIRVLGATKDYTVWNKPLGTIEDFITMSLRDWDKVKDEILNNYDNVHLVDSSIQYGRHAFVEWIERQRK